MSQTDGGRQRGFGSFDGEHEHLERDHLSEVAPRNGVKLDADPGRSEAWCDHCDNRVTVGADEYGHSKDCPFSCWEPHQ